MCTHIRTLSERERIEDRPLTLEVKLHDPERKYRHIAYNAMRDAAISGNRFMHLEIKTDRVDETEAIRSLQEKGYGPPQRIYHLRFFPQIILPNAPSWGWKRDGENRIDLLSRSLKFYKIGPQGRECQRVGQLKQWAEETFNSVG